MSSQSETELATSDGGASNNGDSKSSSYARVPVDGSGRVYDPIPVGVKLAFAAPTVAMLPYVTMFSMHGLVTYEAFGARLGVISVFTALARSFDVVSDPLMSYFTDSTRTRFGRRRPFMLIGSIFYSISLWCLQSPPYGSARAISNWFGVTYILYFFSNTVTCIPYYALAPELSQDPEERTNLFFIMSVFEAVATLVAVALPVIAQTSISQHGWNSWICRPNDAAAALCYSARSCGEVFTDGIAGAFKDNASLAAALAPLVNTTGAVLPPDALSCPGWFVDNSVEVLGESASSAQTELFCSCVSKCSAACSVADARTAFSATGAFFSIWMIISMAVLVYVVQERPPVDTKMEKPPPLVPALLNTMMNAPFRVLLPAWACDSFVNAMVACITPYFVRVVIEPGRQTLEEHGRDCNVNSEDYVGHLFCEPSMVMTAAGICVLAAAIIGLPIWMYAVSKFGKIRVWLAWSLSMAVTNVFFLLLDRGYVIGLFVVAFLNGLPLGAKFLADSILSDIIDYDQFLTGQRNEATYFMFKGFLPKIVQIPASAVPLSLLATVGYIAPVAGKDQAQPESVRTYVRAVVFTCFIFSLIAFLIKMRYPLTTDQHTKELRLGIEAHDRNELYPDPVTNVQYKPIAVDRSLQNMYWVIDHFRRLRLYRMFVMLEPLQGMVDGDPMIPLNSVGLPVEELAKSIDPVRGAWRNRQEQFWQMFFSLLALLVSCVGTAWSMELVMSPAWQWVPTVFAVAVGLSFVAALVSALRLRAAHQMLQLAKGGELTAYVIAHVILHRDLVDRVGVMREEAGPISRVSRVLQSLTGM